MAQIPNEKLDTITDEVKQLHPILDLLLKQLPRVKDVEYHHGQTEMGADFVVAREDDTLGNTEYIGVIAKVGKIVQNLDDIERQIGECELPRTFRGGKEKIRITEVWVISTEHITKGAQEKINHKYANRKIEFIDGSKLEKLVDRYAPMAWSRLPMALGEYLHGLRVRTDEQDKSVSLLQISDKSFYVRQDLYYLPDVEYRYRGKGRAPERMEPEDIWENHRQVLIEGGVGSGKSKLLRMLISESTKPEIFVKSKKLPVHASYTELMERHAGSLEKLIESRVPKEVREVANDVEYVVSIDAFDERRMDVELQADELNALFGQATPEKRIRLIVTSRFLKGIETGGRLMRDVSRFDLRPLSMARTIEFIAKLCTKLNLKDRIIQDLKKSALFRDLPRSPISAILLAHLLNEQSQEIPSNMTELYSKYSELMLGRWDENKGLQSQKEYQALDSILMTLARQMIDDQRLFLSVHEVKSVFKNYLDQRNLEIEPDELFDKMVERCEIVLLDTASNTIGFKHRTFAEYFYAKSFTRDGSLVIDNRVFNVYWMNTFFFYLGLRKDCPDELRAIFDMQTESETEEWLKIINLSNYLLAAYTTPYGVIVDGVENAAVTAARLYEKISTKGSESPFGSMPKMHVLFFLQLFIRYGYAYDFFEKAIEEAALRISDSALAIELKAYALFFLNVTYIDLEKTETFDFMLTRVSTQLPIDLHLALGHEGKKTSERSALMRKQDRYLRRLMSDNDPLANYVKSLYEQPVNKLVKQATKAKERKEAKDARNRGGNHKGKRSRS